MSEQHPMILFVGHPEHGAQLLESVEPMGWVELAAQALDAFTAGLSTTDLVDLLTAHLGISADTLPKDFHDPLVRVCYLIEATEQPKASPSRYGAPRHGYGY